ncbi:MAG: hypothetical protein A4E48_00279 [Methanosaeta sp. PtaU1.Bin060]|nr:MAG: hypothetical protein A4E48_00279 [Methanosaeta sp. PtaU1.Bin060]
MTAAYWSIDWTNKFREMDLAEVVNVIHAAEQVRCEKETELLRRRIP